MKKLMTVLLTGLLVCACAPAQNTWKSQAVTPRKNSPVVLIHPETNAYQEATVGVLPFQVPSNLSRGQGEGVAMLFKDVMLGRRSFPKVLALSEPYRDIQEAIALGRKAKVDLVLAGRVIHALEGSQFGGGRLEVSTRLVNVHTGNTVWHIEQSVDQPVAYPESGTISRFLAAFNPPEIKPSQGAPALANMLVQSASDMTEIIAGASAISR